MNTTKEEKIRSIDYRSDCDLRVEFHILVNEKRYSDESITIMDHRDYNALRIEELLNSFLIDYEYGIRATVELGQVKYVYVMNTTYTSTDTDYFLVRLYNRIDRMWLEVGVSKSLFTSKDVVREFLPPYYSGFSIIEIADPAEKYFTDGNF